MATQYVDYQGNTHPTWEAAALSGAAAGHGYGGLSAEQVYANYGDQRQSAYDFDFDDSGEGESSVDVGRDDRWLPTLEELIGTGVIPPRLRAAMTPLVPGGPDFNYALAPQGGYRPISRQTYNRLHPTDLQALAGTLGFIGNRPEDFLYPYQQPQYTPRIRYGRRVQIG